MSKSSNPEPTPIPIDRDRMASLHALAARLQAAQQAQPESMQASPSAATRMTRLHDAGQKHHVLDRIAAQRREAALAREADAAARGASCPDCMDTGTHYSQRVCDCAIGQEQERQRRLAETNRWLAGIDGEIGIPNRYRNCTLDTFGNQSSPVLAAMRAWLAGDQARGLYIHGNFGRGKTGLVVATLRELVIAHGMQRGMDIPVKRLAQFVTATGMLQSLRPGGDEDDSAKVLRSLVKARVLVIDDLGAERLTDWGADRVFEIVNARHNAEMPTLVTSNYRMDELAKRITQQVGAKMGDRIVERLMESCDMVAFNAAEPNWRTAA